MRPARANRRRLAHKAPAKLDSVRNEINVTPLVDVCLCLLIIFMVILPMLTRGHELKLPMTLNHTNDKDNQEPIVAIDYDEQTEQITLWVDKERVNNTDELKLRVEDAWKALAARNQLLGEKADRSGEQRVLLKAHPKVQYKRVYPIIMALHDDGAIGIDLGTNELDDNKKKTE
jgi:biopolymer transport protein TolR